MPGQEKASLVRAAYIDAEALVKRCLHRSHCFWNEQQARPFQGFDRWGSRPCQGLLRREEAH